MKAAPTTAAENVHKTVEITTGLYKVDVFEILKPPMANNIRKNLFS